ncbi:MAG: hypothetical protein GX491_01715 [Chloroflexi bacterium]|nr:hypothetical protein [Chloroflexota bacterium]
MNKAELKRHLTDLAEEAFPDTLDPWPTLQAHLATSDRDANPVGFSMKTQIGPTKPLLPTLRIAAFLVIALLLAGAVFLITPQGRAWGQAIFQFFNRAETNFMPGVTATPMKWVEQTPGVAAPTITPQPPEPTPPGPAFEAACGSYGAPQCSIEEIRGMVSFPVFALPNLPEGMHFTGATGGPDRVVLSYNTPDQTGFIDLVEEPFTDPQNQLSWVVGADAEIQQVKIGAVMGEYVKGSYDGSSNPPVWNPNIGLQQMRWVNRGVLFTLSHLGSQPDLGRDGLVALAETLTDGPVGDAGQPAGVPTPAPEPEPTFDPRTVLPLTLAQAEELAGFTPLVPTYLPEIWSYIGAAYDEDRKMVEIGYIYTDPRAPWAANSLSIREQLVPEGEECGLCSFVIRTERDLLPIDVPLVIFERTLPPDAIIETVQIGSGTGQFVQGVEYGDGTWDPIPYRKRLRFQTGGMAIEIRSDNNDMTKEDLIAIAESMK